MIQDDSKSTDRSRRDEELPAEPYERPAVTDYGTLTELTLGGLGPVVDLGLSAGGS